MDLEWEGTYGYGDIVSMVANAVWHYHWKKSSVHLRVVWYNDRPWYPPEKKYVEEDPETILERMYLIKDMFVGGEHVTIENEYRVHDGEPNGPRQRTINRLNHDKWWSTQCETKLQPTEGDYICVWTPRPNKDNPAAIFQTAYKDPLGVLGLWDKFDILMQDHDIKYINYRDPVQKTFETVAGAKMCIGYEGIGQFIAKNFWKPMVTFTDQPNLSSRSSGPWAFLDNKLNHKLHDLESLRLKQLPGIEAAKREYYEIRQSCN